MEIKFSTEGLPYAKEEGPRKALRLESLKSAAPDQPSPVSDAEAEGVSGLDKETQKQALSQTAGLLSLFGWELKYEVLEDAGVVQIQVIDAADGRVVRKIPADEVIKLIEAIKEKMDERVDVLA
jgi:uncharacterized FlaG/YvyC family protein